jgi:hypothetical protein
VPKYRYQLDTDFVIARLKQLSEKTGNKQKYRRAAMSQACFGCPKHYFNIQTWAGSGNTKLYAIALIADYLEVSVDKLIKKVKTVE